MSDITIKAGQYTIEVSHDASGQTESGKSVYATVKIGGVQHASIFAESPEEYKALINKINKAVEAATIKDNE